MDEGVLSALEMAKGPLFRCAITLMALGLLRRGWINVSDFVAAYLTDQDRRSVWGRAGRRAAWAVFPILVWSKVRPDVRGVALACQAALCVVSLAFRVMVVIVPAFMVAHVYLWERGLGLSWTALPPVVTDVLSLAAIATGCLVMLTKLYSRFLRQIEPWWAPVGPLLLILPFVTGLLATHPTWCPVDYHVMMLCHVIFACLVFMLLPFTRLLRCIHTPLAEIMPEVAWSAASEAAPESAVDRPVVD